MTFSSRSTRLSSSCCLLTLAVCACSSDDATTTPRFPQPSGPAPVPAAPGGGEQAAPAETEAAPADSTDSDVASPRSGEGVAAGDLSTDQLTDDASSEAGGGEDTGGGDEATTPEGPSPVEGFGAPVMNGSGQSDERFENADVTRDGQNYFFMANGWGPGFEEQTVSWAGTAFTVDSMQGTQGPQYQPASYPTVFCGLYSNQASGECGLPAAVDDLTRLQTGWMWRPNGNDGQYNAAYDIWMSTGPTRDTFSGFLMVWLREPAGQQPAGSLLLEDVTVANVPGSWDIWTGMVNRRPIINWVRAEGDDSLELEFDVLDFIRDANARGLELPGDHVLSVAVGFEIWNGPVENLESVDFYVDVQ